MFDFVKTCFDVSFQNPYWSIFLAQAGEKIGIAIMKFLKPMMVFGLAKYRGVPAITVARCMVRVLNSDDHGINIIRSDKIS